MYFKIAFHNIKKSFKDYGIYFLTLTFAVCIFYSFNSIGDQQAMKSLSESTQSYVNLIKNAMSGVSVFVSFILGGLMIYANNFLIKRRKKEFGVYMMLGMGKKRISQILILETFSIGIISLIVGLSLGMILSQLLSIFTAKLFELSISQYKFLISLDSIIKTLIYFGIIFLIVMIFNLLVINKYKLIDLLTASKKNEKITTRNSGVSFIIFILGALVLISAYYSILKYGVKLETMTQLTVPIILGTIGTFLFFFGIAGFILSIIKRKDNIYLKGLNIFITKQISSKINTNFVSMSLISLMLFITIVSLSSGLGLKNSLDGNLSKTTPFDGTLQIYNVGDSKNITIEKVLKEHNIVIPKDYVQAEYETYNSKISLTTLLGIDKFYGNADLMPVTQYNRLMELEGKPTVKLDNNKALLTADNNKTINQLNKYLSSGKEININGVNYSFENKSVLDRSYETSGMTLNLCTIIVPDDAIKGLDISGSYLDLNYKHNLKAGDKFTEDIGLKYGIDKSKNSDVFILASTRTQVYANNKGSTTLMLFITIYLGIIFLLTSAAVLALQQLSEASDSIDRYKSLRKIGVSEKMINRSVFYQTLIYFGAPLTLAIIDSIIGLIFANTFITSYGEQSILISALTTFLLLMIIYLGYFIATYLSYKNVIKNNSR